MGTSKATPKICCIFNLAPHYRAPIYKLMDRDLGCDFYFGDKVQTPIKTMDVTELKGYKKKLKNIYIPKTGFEWQKGAWRLIFKPYTHYIITGTPGSLSNWLLLIWSKLLGKNVFAWSHGIKGNETKNGLLIAKSFFRLCDRILLYGERGKAKMEQLGFETSKLVPIYNSLDYETQKQIRKTLAKNTVYTEHFKNDLPVLIYIGRVQKPKRLDLLLEALDVLRTEKSPCNLVIVGEIVDDHEISNLTDKLNLNKHVWFYGPCYDEKEIGNLMYNADVCVSPDAIGLTALHALTYGTPVITSDNFEGHGPEFEAIEEQITGNFFKKGDFQDLTLKIKDWINISPEKKERTREKAYETIDDRYNSYNQISIIKKLIIKN